MLIHTTKQPWINIGTMDDSTGAADAALGVAERDYVGASALANTVSKIIPDGINTIEVRFLMTTNGANAVMDVWAVRLDSQKVGDMVRVCSLDVECGLHDANNANGLALAHYVDEIIITNNDWIKNVIAVQSGNDTDLMARLVFDLCGYDAILFHGHTTFAEDVQVEISGF